MRSNLGGKAGLRKANAQPSAKNKALDILEEPRTFNAADFINRLLFFEVLAAAHGINHYPVRRGQAVNFSLNDDQTLRLGIAQGLELVHRRHINTGKFHGVFLYRAWRDTLQGYSMNHAAFRYLCYSTHKNDYA